MLRPIVDSLDILMKLAVSFEEMLKRLGEMTGREETNNEGKEPVGPVTNKAPLRIDCMCPVCLTLDSAVFVVQDYDYVLHEDKSSRSKFAFTRTTPH